MEEARPPFLHLTLPRGRERVAALMLWRRSVARDAESPLSGRRVFAFLEGGDDRVLGPAIEAVRSGGGCLVLVGTAPSALPVSCGIPYQAAPMPPGPSGEELASEALCRAVARVPADIPVTTVCAKGSCAAAMARLLCRVHPDLVFVSRRRTAARCRRLADARVALVDRGGHTRLA